MAYTKHNFLVVWLGQGHSHDLREDGILKIDIEITSHQTKYQIF